MEPEMTSLERAFLLAKTGKYLNVAAIKRRLKDEGYSADQVTGPRLEAQLRAIIEESCASRVK
jgi:hypothetical protein